jgi:hypothetical protein
MSSWHIYVRKKGNQYTLTDHLVGGTADRFFSLEIAGPNKPVLPSEPVGYVEYLEWQLRLLKTGYTIEEQVMP